MCLPDPDRPPEQRPEPRPGRLSFRRLLAHGTAAGSSYRCRLVADAVVGVAVMIKEDALAAFANGRPVVQVRERTGGEGTSTRCGVS